MSTDAAASTEGATTDEARFERLYSAHYQAVMAYCLRRTLAADAHDVTAETFLVALRKLDAVPAGDQARPWLYGVAFNVLSHRWRRARRDRRILDKLRAQPVPLQRSPELQIVRSTEHELVNEAAQQLKPADQEILRLTMWEELSNAEIATALGISSDAAKQRFHRAKNRLAKAYTRLGGHDPTLTTAPKGGAV